MWLGMQKLARIGWIALGSPIDTDYSSNSENVKSVVYRVDISNLESNSYPNRFWGDVDLFASSDYMELWLFPWSGIAPYTDGGRYIPHA